MLREHRLGVELHALERQLPVPHRHHHVGLARLAGAGGGDLEAVGHQRRRERVVAHHAEPLRQPREHAGVAVLDLADPAVGRRDPLHATAVRRHQALHAQAHAQHGAGGPQQHLAPHAEVRGVVRVPRPRREHDVAVLEHRLGGRLVVLHHPGQPPGHRGHEVDEVLGVGVVVVDHHDVGDGHDDARAVRPLSPAAGRRSRAAARPRAGSGSTRRGTGCRCSAAPAARARRRSRRPRRR